MDNKIKKSIIFTIVILLILTGFSSYSNADFLTVKNSNKKDFQNIFSQIGNYEYVIITNEYLVDSDFQRLLDHKSQYITTNIVATEDILSNPDFKVNGKYGDATNSANGNHWIANGKEVTENISRFDEDSNRIRNFIRFAYDQWNTKYVLLGGDVEIIPAKKLRINETWWYAGNDFKYTWANIRADHYYAALDGTWNDDFDEFFGEAGAYSVDDEADFEAEVFIGRAPVEEKREVKIFVDKVINFETSEKPENMLFHQAGLNRENNPDSSVIPEICYTQIPDQYVVYKLYQIYTSIDATRYARHWQDPDKLIVLQIGSGSKIQYYMERRLTGDKSFTTDDITLFNNTFCPVHISISCNSGNFGLQHDCLAEEMLLYPDSGPSACIFNSFFGCVSPDDAHKYSGEFIEKQFYEIFQEGTEKLGEIVTLSKYHFINQAENDLLYRWCYYTVTLLGDPETPLFEVRNKIPNNDKVYVDDDYNQNTPGWGITHFDKINNALNKVDDSGTIYVYSGEYQEQIIINKPINIIGENKETTTITGDYNGDVIKIYDEAMISGFRIQKSGNNQNDAAIGIFSPMSIIKNNTITQNNLGIKTNYIDSYYPIDNHIYNNNFLNNNKHIKDEFLNKIYGNYWDDYTGVDNDDDGIGDTSYNYENGDDLCPFITMSGWNNGVNHKPILPIITGPKNGKPNIPYSYDFETADPDGDKTYMFIDMGDYAFDEWIGPLYAYDLYNILYYWANSGVYIIRAKAKDSSGLETDWVTYTVKMPRTKNANIKNLQNNNILIKILSSLRIFESSFLYRYLNLQI